MNFALHTKVFSLSGKGVALGVVLAFIAARGEEKDDLRARVEAAAARFPELRWEPPREQDNGWQLLVEARDRIEAARPADLLDEDLPSGSGDDLIQPADPLRLAKLRKWVAATEDADLLYARAFASPRTMYDPETKQSAKVYVVPMRLAGARMLVRLADGKPDLAMQELARFTSHSSGMAIDTPDQCHLGMTCLYHGGMLNTVKELARLHPESLAHLPPGLLTFTPVPPVAKVVGDTCRQTFSWWTDGTWQRHDRLIRNQQWFRNNPGQYDPVEGVNEAGSILTALVQAAKKTHPLPALQAVIKNLETRYPNPNSEPMGNGAFTSLPLLFVVAMPEQPWTQKEEALLDKLCAGQTNAISRFMARSIPLTPDSIQLLYRQHTRTWVAQIQLAALLHRSRTGRWPETMAQLVSAGILREIPTNPIDGNPVQIQLERKQAEEGQFEIRSASGRTLAKREGKQIPILLHVQGLGETDREHSLPLDEIEKRFQALELKTRK